MYGLNLDRLLELLDTELKYVNPNPFKSEKRHVLFLIDDHYKIKEIEKYLIEKFGTYIINEYDNYEFDTLIVTIIIIKYNEDKSTIIISLICDMCIYYGTHLPPKMKNEISPTLKEGGMFFSIAPLRDIT